MKFDIRTYFKTRILFLSLLAGFGSLLGYLGKYYYFFELINSLRHYFILFLLLGIFMSLWLKKKLFFRLSLLLLTLNLITVGNWNFSKGSSGKKKISIMSFNLSYLNPELDKAVQIIKEYDPDIFIAMELPMRNYRGLTLQDKFPYEFIHTREDGFGIGLYSRFKPEHKNILLTPQNIPFLRVKVKGFNIFAVHPLHPTSRDYFEDRAFLYGSIPRRKNQVVIGDFNAVPWSSVLASLKKKAELKDIKKGYGTLIPTWGIFPVLAPIDGCLVSHNIVVENYRLISMPGSDHKAVYVELSAE